MEEIWKDIKGYEGLYQISNLGRVKSLGNGKSRKEKILKPRKNSAGYLRVMLCKEGKIKDFYIHRLVANTFLSNPNNYTQINHKNEIKTCNYVSNLEWCTAKYNINYGSHNESVRKAQKCKKVICIETNVTYESIREASRQTGIHQWSISNCCNGKRNTAGGCHWKFID